MNSYIPLDLKAFLNNRGCTLLSENHLGALSLMGASFPAEEFPFDKPLTFYDIPFELKQAETGDNIECTEQIISFAPCMMKGLHILGTSSNTDLFDDILFFHKGVVVHRSKLYLSSFSSLVPAFSDRLALTLSYLHTRTGRYDHIKPKLWYYSLKFPSPQTVESFQFADNPSMHVFAMTIETA
ncbi:hypothetical protein [Tengunoibacter tsumagoiensis]|uniref:Uncharacterized protein n=1 Tax=Tengunoibacter tsumagoiensis TaxID=2014871 RepID=A0A401ZZX4_9CHLR|nr:hypothetical protein [Tengunoibacter tsumagoiensis]GCE12376.1 hypothetical protein KTT_22350 [Tengunoibacter tsumagoiensis]